MASPFYVQMPDLFGGQMKARQAAQEDFSNQLGKLYAAGDQKAGQALGGVDPTKADAIRAALEKLPGTEQQKIKGRTDLLKKNLYAISQEPDESTRALLWNQMLGQMQAAGADISQMESQYSPQALQSHLNETLTFEEAIAAGKEKRIAASAGGSGTEGERRDAELAGGDPTSTEWQTKYLNRYMTPQRTGFNPITGAPQSDFIPAPFAIAQKALSVGLGLNQPSQQVFDAFSKRQPPAATPPSDTLPTGVAPGEITTPGAMVNGKPLPAPPPVVPQTTTTGPAPGMSRAERERIAAEERAAAREKEKGTDFSQAQNLDAAFAARMDQASNVLNKNPNYVPNEASIIGYKSDLTRRLVPEEYKVYRQAQENWISANLRRESGAVIGTDEMDKEIKKYFPSPGDTADVAKQKAESRRIAEEGMKQSAGGAYSKLKQTLGTPSAPGGKRIRIDASGNIIK